MTAPIMRDGREFRSGAWWLRHCRVMGFMVLVAWGGVLGQGEDEDDRRGLQDFSLSITPVTGDVVQGASRTYTVELASIDSDGFDDEISLTISGLGTGVTGTADNGLTRTVSGSVTVKARQPTSFSISATGAESVSP